MSDVDAACDHALGCSKIAAQTHDPAHHAAAKASHENAYAQAKMAGRDSLAQSHLQQAALHDKHADPSTPEGKGELAHQASAKARASGKPEDHEAAAQAHEDASSAHDQGPPNGRAAGLHSTLAFQHTNAANKIKNPPRGPADGLAYR